MNYHCLSKLFTTYCSYFVFFSSFFILLFLSLSLPLCSSVAAVSAVLCLVAAHCISVHCVPCMRLINDDEDIADDDCMVTKMSLESFTQGKTEMWNHGNQSNKYIGQRENVAYRKIRMISMMCLLMVVGAGVWKFSATAHVLCRQQLAYVGRPVLYFRKPGQFHANLQRSLPHFLPSLPQPLSG